MVGIGGRSKACANCYRRRIKCDETRPKCKRCAKAKLECGGYNPITIVQYDGPRRETAESGDTQTASSTALTNTNTPRKSDVLNLIVGRDLKPDPDDVFVNYTLSNLLNAGRQLVVASGIDRELADLSFLALSTFFFGNEHKESAVVEYGLRRYGKALKKLNTALADPSRRRSYDVMESVIVLVMLEYLMSDCPDGWVAHSVGLEQLFTIRGPQSFTSKFECTILERSRPTIIYASIVLRKATILSQPEWKTIPWKSNPDDKLMYDHLIDILADCPELLVLQDEMFAVGESPEAKNRALAIQSQVYALKYKLSEWKKKWDAAEPDCRFEEPDKPGRTKSAGYSNFIYKSLYHANTVAMYDATAIFLDRIIVSTLNYEPLSSDAVNDLAQSTYDASIDIVRSIDSCVAHARGGLGNFHVLFPIRLAWVAMRDRGNCALQASLESKLRNIQFGAAGRWAVAGYILKIEGVRIQPRDKR